MKRIFFIILTLTSFNLFSQTPCGSIIEKIDLPISYSLNSALPPDPCDAKSDYGTERDLIVSTNPVGIQIKKKIKILVETLIDPDNCQIETREISRDTIEVGREKVYVASIKPVGGYWTVRMELMVYAPVSRPSGCFATKLPNRSMDWNNQFDLKDYWVVHTGNFQSLESARLATIQLKEMFPEFCRAYPYFLPEGCKEQYQYKSKINY